jgi:Histidine kinase-, DNA gyrase B-, and HSP90-like ATPase
MEGHVVGGGSLVTGGFPAGWWIGLSHAELDAVARTGSRPVLNSWPLWSRQYSGPTTAARESRPPPSRRHSPRPTKERNAVPGTFFHLIHRSLEDVISDTGIGIPSDKLDEIFQPFVQVDGGHTRRYGGTGLGLSICQRLAQALDGRLEVTSELGRGSTFTLTIDASCLAPRTRRDATGRAMTTSRNKYVAGSQP